MNGLALCSGIGGFDLALKLALPGYRTVCHVEGEAYAAAVLRARMADKALDEAPIWSDLATFDGKPWRGVVDIVTAGLPCQPYSVAGKQKGHEDERAIWPEFVRVVSECMPALVFIENVPRFIKFFQPIGERLSEMGYAIEAPFLASPAELGAGHIRWRLFILAHLVGNNIRLQSRWGERESGEETVAYRQIPGNTPGIGAGEPTNEKNAITASRKTRREPARATWWGSEPGVERVVHGISNGVDRSRTLGNAVVPLVAAHAFRTLVAELSKE